jgi:hypothetical protein
MMVVMEAICKESYKSSTLFSIFSKPGMAFVRAESKLFSVSPSQIVGVIVNIICKKISV